MTETLTATATLWLWTSPNAPASWHFLTVEGEAAEAINALALMRRLEFGKKARLGFDEGECHNRHHRLGDISVPEKSSGGWLLPVKAAVRKAEGLMKGDSVKVSLTV